MEIPDIAEVCSNSRPDYQPERTCFIISPTGEEGSETRQRAEAVFHNIVEPAAAVAGLRCVRSDGISTSGILTAEVISHIVNDRIVLADLSDRDPTVLERLALRHALRKPVVQLLAFGEKSLLCAEGVHTVRYDLSSAASAQAAREAAQQHMAAAMQPARDVDFPATIAAKIEELSRSFSQQIQKMSGAMLDQIAGLNKSVAELRSSSLLSRPDDLKGLIRSAFEVRTEDLLGRFADQLDLLKSVKEAGLISVEKGRVLALKVFARDLDEEFREIMVVGSSLKGLLQQGEVGEIAEKLRFKVEHGVRVWFLLSHPIVGDFRGSQENLAPTKIGSDIVASLKILRSWHVDPACVRLYIGPPTCFAITTSRRMVINPYSYLGASYDSPCMILDCSGYLFEQFGALHFGAWDTGLAVQIHDFDDIIERCEAMLGSYASDVSSLVSKAQALAGAAGK